MSCLDLESFGKRELIKYLSGGAASSLDELGVGAIGRRVGTELCLLGVNNVLISGIGPWAAGKIGAAVCSSLQSVCFSGMFIKSCIGCGEETNKCDGTCREMRSANKYDEELGEQFVPLDSPSLKSSSEPLTTYIKIGKNIIEVKQGEIYTVTKDGIAVIQS